MPSIILRVETYLETSPPTPEEMNQTNDARYHGGVLDDEIAAMVSLICGVRLKSGGITRLFDFDSDQRGKPVHYEMDKNPILLKGESRPIIPNARRTAQLKDLWRLTSYPTLSPKDAITIVKASRLYQDALWIAESEPELAWIMFVSAIETAADHWDKSKVTPVEKFEAENPELLRKLIDVGGVTLAEEVANFVASKGVTKRFIDFILKFLPPEPMNRPAESARHSWEKPRLSATLKKIYDYRSKALHEGKSFPSPMCTAPMIIESSFSEIPLGLAASARGGFWVKKDIPILLNTFEHIARGALLKWWDSLIPKK